MPICWIVFGSIDKEKSRTELLEIDKIHAYNVNHTGIYKYLKLIMTENKRNDKSVLSFGKIDFFGDLLYSLHCTKRISKFSLSKAAFPFHISLIIMLL